MRGLNVGSKPAEWSTSTSTLKSKTTSFTVNVQTQWSTYKMTSKSTTTSFSTSQSTTTSWTTSKSTTTTFNTSQSTSKSTTTTFSTSKSTTTSWTTSRSTTTTFNTSQSTTTTFTTTFSTSKSTTTTFSTSKSTTTSWTTSKSTTTSWTTTWSTSKSTTTTYSTSKSTTTTWSTSKSTTTSWTTSQSTTTNYTTSWNSSRSTTESRNTYKTTTWTTSDATGKDRLTQKYLTTSWITLRNTGGFFCVVENQLVHYNTYQATDISQFGSGSSILEMDTPFNYESVSSYDELFEISSSVIDNGGGLQTGSVIDHMVMSASGEIINFNQYDLLLTGEHPQPIFRSGSWMVSEARNIQIGDGLLNISGSNPTGSIVWVWDIDIDTTGSYVVHKFDTEPHDVFFVNGFLTHNKDKLQL